VLGPVVRVDEIDSTNAELLRRAAAGAPAGMVLVARHQTAGRGRLDRSWEAPAGASLLTSVLLRPGIEAADLHLVTAAAGLAAVRACEHEGATGVSLKWPNDVVVDDGDETRKLAGLLAESTVEGGRVAAVVVGMGLNANWSTPVPAGGISLGALLGRTVDIDHLLEQWIEGFDERLDALEGSAGPAQLRAEHRARCSTVGRAVRVETTHGVVTGVAEAIDDRGRLVVDGQAFSVGDVIHVRPVSGT